MSFFGFIVVAPFLLIVLLIYLHIFYGYWIACEWERQYINQRLIPPIEGMPTLFSLPAVVPRVLTGFIFYWLVPLVLGVITWKAWAFHAMGRPLTYVSGVVTFILVFLQIRRLPDTQRKWWTLIGYTVLTLTIELTVLVTFTPQSFQRPLNLFREELPKAWLVGIDMSRARADFANFEGANLEAATLQRADLQGVSLAEANLQRANLLQANLVAATLQRADLQGALLMEAELSTATLRQADLQGANLLMANLWRAQLQGANLQGASLWWANLAEATLQEANLQGVSLAEANLQGANLQRANLQGANLQRANLQGANLQGANLQGANLQGANLQGANLQGANLQEAKNLTQDQVNAACGDEGTQLPKGLTKPASCPNVPLPPPPPPPLPLPPQY
jgi:uncharacterized protein YjbI with pentapeptide repeats